MSRPSNQGDTTRVRRGDPDDPHDQNGAACAFCRVVRGQTPTYRVAEDDRVLAFLDARPLLPGHCLVVPKTHYATLSDLPGDLVAPLFAAVQRLAVAVEVGLGADGSFVAINTRISQSVAHLHVHVVPRWKGDGLFARRRLWTRHPYPDEDAAVRIQTAIRAGLQRLDHA